MASLFSAISDVHLANGAAQISRGEHAVVDGPRFEDVYRAHFAFVWRSVVRLGANPNAVDDVVQDVFLVVHRRLADFQQWSSMKTWIFGIVRRVVADHRRTIRRKPSWSATANELEALHDTRKSPASEQLEAFQLVHVLLDELDAHKREVFVLAEFEEMTLVEIAEITGATANTVASRLRAARKIFTEALERHEASGGRPRGEEP